MDIILFGAGKMTTLFLERDDSFQYNILAVADNDKTKHGSKISVGNRCLDVISAEEIVSYSFDMILITLYNFSHQLEIASQLVSLGLSRDVIKFLHNTNVVNCVTVKDEHNYPINNNTFLFDVTSISIYDYGTGIQRVVRELYRNLLDLGINICPVQAVNTKWITARSFDCRIKNKAFDDIEYVVTTEGKRFFLSDSWWGIAKLLESMHASRDVCVIVYDLIAILNPECVYDYITVDFSQWIDKVLKFASKCVCISKAVANDVINYYQQNKYEREKPLDIYYMHLGFDIPKIQEYVRNDIDDFVKLGTTFLIVGTVEIRKNHYLLLRSFKRVCQEFPDKQIQLLILGRDGWKNDDFKEMFETDNIIRERCLWVKDASDSEIQWAYQHCVALVYPSRTEGFGLPLVEAAHFKLPILCSDIPIFREVVGDNADFFKVNDEDSLSEALIAWINSARHPDSGKVKMYTWQECAEEVLDIMEGKVAPYRTLC